MSNEISNNRVDRGYRCPEWINSSDLQKAMNYFLSQHPNEGVGIINENGFVPLENISDDPTKAFRTVDDAWITNGTIKAVLHSHVNGRGTPSSADIECQCQGDVPWGIYVTDGEYIGCPVWFGDQLTIPDVFERQFLHGIHDCYSIIRDVFRLGKDALATNPDAMQRIFSWPFDPITLREIPRDDRWWEQGKDLYTQQFEDCGFEEIAIDRRNLKDVRIGDCFLYKLGVTPVANHAGVYVGNNLILHHVEGYTSMRAPLSLYGYSADKWLRYTGKV